MCSITHCSRIIRLTVKQNIWTMRRYQSQYVIWLPSANLVHTFVQGLDPTSKPFDYVPYMPDFVEFRLEFVNLSQDVSEAYYLCVSGGHCDACAG